MPKKSEEKHFATFTLSGKLWIVVTNGKQGTKKFFWQWVSKEIHKHESQKENRQETLFGKKKMIATKKRKDFRQCELKIAKSFDLLPAAKQLSVPPPFPPQSCAGKPPISGEGKKIREINCRGGRCTRRRRRSRSRAGSDGGGGQRVFFGARVLVLRSAP